MKKALQNTYKSVIQAIQYKDSIPLLSSFNQDELNNLVKEYNNRFINYELIRDEISNTCFDKQLELQLPNSSKTIQFTESQIYELAYKIDKLLTSLPIMYEFVFRMPTSQNVISGCKFRNNLDILTAGSEVATYQPKKSKDKSLTGLRSMVEDTTLNPIHIKKGDVILRVRTRGYVGKYGSVQLDSEDPIYIYKVISAIYMNLGILIPYKSVVNPFNLKSYYSYYIFSNKDKGFIRKQETDGNDDKFIRNNQFDPSAFSPSALDRLVGETKPRIEYANDVIKKIIMNIPVNFKEKKQLQKEQQRIRNSCFWYYEAKKSPESLVKTINTVTAFDASIGNLVEEDGKKIHLTSDAKATLVAQVISSTVREEAFYQKEIRNLFELRNDIVHGNKSISSLRSYQLDSSIDKRTINFSKHDTTIYFGLQALNKYLNKRITAFSKSFST